jgi:hypothetical protein
VFAPCRVKEVFEQDELWVVNGLEVRSNLLGLNDRSLRRLFAIVNNFLFAIVNNFKALGRVQKPSIEGVNLRENSKS